MSPDPDADPGTDDEADADPAPSAGDPDDPPAVLFDMDGVVVDSEPHWHAFEDAFVFGEATAGDPAHEEVTGMNYREIYDYLDDEYGVTVPREAFLGRYESHAIDVYTDLADPMAGTPAVLGAVRDAGVTTGVVSSARRRWIGLVLARLSLEPLDLATSAEEVAGPGKPEPDVYEDAAARVGRAPADCVVIEDSTNGVRAGVAAGCFTIGFRATHNADYDLSAADRVVEGAGELADALSERVGIEVAAD